MEGMFISQKRQKKQDLTTEGLADKEDMDGKKRVLITGSTGFAGSHLAELLVSKGTSIVYGTHLTDREISNLDAVKEQVKLYKVNLLKAEETFRVIEEVHPDIIFHLAASTSVADSFNKPADVITNNAASEVNIFEAVRALNLVNTRIIITSSAHVYGLVSQDSLPIDESTPMRPDSPYSVSKITQDYLGLSYFNGYKLPIIILRPFNHAGPRLSPSISISRFAKSIAEIEKGIQAPVLKVGNLSTKRDFTDVHDMVKAYVLAAERCTAGEAYNIGTGVSHSMQEMLDKLLSISTVKITVTSDQTLFRPSDIPELRCNPIKFKKATGWEPEISIEQTLQSTLDYWRKVI
jgi:GDP-4-dehydro-6-deoxy-D-mannose reductase